MADLGVDLAELADDQLRTLADSLSEQIRPMALEHNRLWTEIYRRRRAEARQVWRLKYGYHDDKQRDQDEYAEEMSLGGRTFNPRR